MAMASRSGTGTAPLLCFLVASLLLASSFVAGTEAAAAYGAGRKMKQTAAGAVATKQYSYPGGYNAPDDGYPIGPFPPGYHLPPGRN